MASFRDLISPIASRLWNGETKSSVIGSDAIWRDILGAGNSKSGQIVNVNTALSVTTVLCCARVRAEGLAQVPCRVYQATEGGGRREAIEHPLYRLLYRRPNDTQTSFEFREQIGFHLALCGNAYVYKSFGSDGRLIELLPYEPGCVTVRRGNNYEIAYSLRLANGTTVDVPQSNMWHIRGASWNGYMGMAAIEMARNAVGMALAAEEFGSELFANGARPSGILSTDSTIQPEAAAMIKASWDEAQTGSGNRMKTAMLQGGLKWQSVAQTADEAQFIEARKFQVVEICRSMRVLPIMAMHQDGTAAYASIEQMFLAHNTHTLGPDFERFEQSAEVNLLSEKDQRDGYYVELVESNLARGTLKDRAEVAAMAVQNGAAYRNEFRDAIDLPRVDDVDANRFIPSVNLYGPVTVEEA